MGQEVGLKAYEVSIQTLADSTVIGPGSEDVTGLGPNPRDGPATWLDLVAIEKTENTVLGGSNYVGPSSVRNSDFSRVDFNNKIVSPSMAPSSGFQYSF